jgi:AcrR family transcriptional regulator
VESSIERDLSMFPANTGDDLRGLWIDFSGDPDPSNRDRLIYLTMREVAVVGPATFNTAGVCDTLGISYPMVNYYFGNRDGLLAEAAQATYVRYIAKLWAAVEAAPRTPVDRLRAYLVAHLRLNVEIRGWGAVLNYPIFSSTIAQLLDERFGEEHHRHFELNMARVGQLILDLWDDRVTAFDYPAGEIPRDEMMQQPGLMEAAATLSWAALGVAVWRSGRHSPSRGITELEQDSDHFIDRHTETLIRVTLDARPEPSTGR